MLIINNIIFIKINNVIRSNFLYTYLEYYNNILNI